MKIEKFMCDVTRALLKGKNVHFWKQDNKTCITFNGIFAMIVPNNIFNCEISQIQPFDWYEYTKPCKDTKELKVSGKDMLRVIEANGKKIYLNEKYVKYFDNPEFFTNGKGGIAIKERGNVVGIIMEVRVNE